MNIRTAIIAVLLSATIVCASETTSSKQTKQTVSHVRQEVRTVQPNVQPDIQQTVQSAESNNKKKSNRFGELRFPSRLFRGHSKLFGFSGFPFSMATAGSQLVPSIAFPSSASAGLTSGLTSSANIFKSYLGSASAAGSRPRIRPHYNNQDQLLAIQSPVRLTTKIPFSSSLPLPELGSPIYPGAKYYPKAGGYSVFRKYRGRIPRLPINIKGALFSPKDIMMASKLKAPKFSFQEPFKVTSSIVPKYVVDWSYVKPNKVKYLLQDTFVTPRPAVPTKPLEFYLPKQPKLPAIHSVHSYKHFCSCLQLRSFSAKTGSTGSPCSS